MQGRQRPARLGEGEAVGHLGRGQPRQAGAERAHLRPGRAHQQPVLGEALARPQVDHGEPDLDDLAHLAGRWLPLPAGGLDIDHVQQVRVDVHGASA